MKSICIMMVAILLGSTASSQDFNQYNVVNIADELKENANLVIRDYDLQFEILPSHHLRQKTYKVKTILNKSAEHESTMVIFYDKFRKVKKFSATTLDKNGKVVKKLKKSEVLDVSIAENSVDDSRVKAADMSHTEYPYTVVFDFEVEFDGLFYYPNYAPQPKEGVAVQNSSFTINCPADKTPRYKELNIKITEKSPTHLRWEVKNLAAFEDIPFSPDITDFVPVVLTAPTEFVLDGHKGNMATWAGFADWYHTLNKGRDILSEEDVAKAKEITSGLNSTEEKIKAIYAYMQAKTRYVSVQLGIGGYQTMPATDVSEDGWGDCKALSNYTKGLLKAVGIDAYPALVYAGRGVPNIVTEFPSNQFNHVILCVPLAADTVWLECTSREVPYNFLGDFTDDRDVLFVDEKNGGGKIVRTPRYDADDNYEYRKAIVTLDENGHGQAKIKTRYGGLSFDKLMPYLDEPEEKLTKTWYEKIKIPGYTINHIAFDYDKSSGPETDLIIDLTLKSYASRSGKRIFFKPNMMNKLRRYPKVDEDRELDVVTSSEYVAIDTIEYILPDGFHPERLPEDVHYDSQFGTYSATYKMSENGLLYIRQLRRYKGRYPKESFNELSTLLKNIKRADNQKVVLVGST